MVRQIHTFQVFQRVNSLAQVLRMKNGFLGSPLQNVRPNRRPLISEARSLICLVIFTVLLTPFKSWAYQHVVIADFSLGVDENGIPSGWELKESYGK